MVWIRKKHAKYIPCCSRGNRVQIRPGGNWKRLGDHTPNMDAPCEVQRCAVQFRNVAHTAKWGSFVPVKKQRCGEMYYVSRRLDRRSNFMKDLRKRKEMEKPRRRSRENSMREEAEGCKSTSDRRKRSGSMSHLSKASGVAIGPHPPSPAPNRKGLQSHGTMVTTACPSVLSRKATATLTMDQPRARLRA